MQKTNSNKSLVIFILGLLTALSPFTIDMYLPAFESIAADFNTTVAQISLSLSSYFIGLSFGQLIYGPLSDRFGRKRPLYVGLSIYLISAIFCIFAKSSEQLIVWRLIQALGGCAAGVTAMAMVRDLFTTQESARVFSLLILILGTSPLLAPTVGSMLSVSYGWPSIFITLAVMSGLLLIVVKFKLPESHEADASVKLNFSAIGAGYFEILKNPLFYTYAFSSAIAFSGLFVYLAGSPIIFLQTFAVSPQVYGWIFGIIAAGLIGSSQLNVILLKHYSNQQLLRAALTGQVVIAALFFIGTYSGGFGLIATVSMLFLFLACFGITNPNGGALALAPFAKNAGSAAALIGFLQMGTGALASMCIGLLSISTMLPIIGIMFVTSSLGLAMLFFGFKQIKKKELL